MNIGSCQPRRWDETERLEPEPTQAIETTLHAGRSGTGVEGQELTLPRGPAHGSHTVPRAAGQPHFIVPLAMEDDFGTLSGTVMQPR
jgi:hypothetical protein